MSRQNLTLFGPHRPKRNPWDPVCAEHSSANKRKEREPWAVTYRRLCYAFICSAFVHVCGDVLLQFRLWGDFSSTCASGTMNSPNVIGYSAPYFILQPVGVLVEDAVVEAGKRMGSKEGTWTRIVGYAWVLVFTSSTYAFSLDGLTKAFRLGDRPGEGMQAPTTLIEVIADRVFGIQLTDRKSVV